MGLKDSTACPAFFIAPAMKPRTVCFCHALVRMISVRVAPFLRRSMPITSAVLLPWRGDALQRRFRDAQFLTRQIFVTETVNPVNDPHEIREKRP